MKINKIKKDKNGRYTILFTNGETLKTYDEIILKYQLLFNQDLTIELIEQIKKESNNYDEYCQVLKYVTKKVRCEKEVRDYLEQHDIIGSKQNEFLDKLKKAGALNDSYYLKAFVADKIRLSNDGPLKIKQFLIKMGFTEKEVMQELCSYDDFICQKLKKLILKKNKENKKYSENFWRQKNIDFFKKLGYSEEMILSCYQVCPSNQVNQANQTDILKKEYDRLQKKLSAKYQGEALEYQIKGRLYQNGFSLEEIADILNFK